MATFTYARKDGSQGSLEAADANAAIKLLPVDADPHSGVQSSLSGTGASSPSGSTTGSLPDSNQSPLLSFASSLDAAVNLARKGRNKSSLDLMAPYRGTVAASDFNSILGNMNAASDKTSSDLIKRATETQTPDIITATSDNGDVHGIDKTTGKILWTAKGAGNQQGGGSGGAGTVVGGVINSGKLVISPTDIQTGAQALKASALQGTEADGKYADPNVYLNMYKHWVDQGGSAKDFLKFYPANTWINPTNTWVLSSITEYNNQGSDRSL